MPGKHSVRGVPVPSKWRIDTLLLRIQAAASLTKFYLTTGSAVNGGSERACRGANSPLHLGVPPLAGCHILASWHATRMPEPHPLRIPSVRTGTTAHAVGLPRELLHHIFSLLRQPLDRTEDAWIPHRFEAQHAALLCAMRVCGPWHAVASEVFYRVVRPRTVEACVQLSITLTSNAFIANAVRVVELPKSVMLLSHHAEELSLPMRQVRARLADAVDTIIRLCVHAADFCTYSGCNEVADTYRLRDLSSDLRYLCLNKSKFIQTYAEDNWLDTLRRVTITMRSYFSLRSLNFPKLQLLRLAGDATFRDLQPGVSLRATFPRLRALFLSQSSIPQQHLVLILRALESTLEVLSLCNVRVGQCLLLVLNDAVPGSAFATTLQDLRLSRVSYLPSFPETIPESELKGMLALGALTRLTIDSECAAALAHIPPSVVQITVDVPCRRWASPGAMKSLLAAASILRRRMPQWKACAAGLSLVRQRGANRLVAELRAWQIHCFMLKHVSARCGIQLHTDIWCVPHYCLALTSDSTQAQPVRRATLYQYAHE